MHIDFHNIYKLVLCEWVVQVGQGISLELGRNGLDRAQTDIEQGQCQDKEREGEREREEKRYNVKIERENC